MIFLELFTRFFFTGLFAIGGGLATLPFLQSMGETTGWFTPTDISDMIAISESTPGPIGVNMATYVGYQTGEAFGVAGGILGGISNGNEIVFRIAIKPVPSIFKKQNTIDIFDNETEILIEGRHDICLCPRIIPVVEAMTSITLLDLFLQNKCSNFYKDKGISKL